MKTWQILCVMSAMALTSCETAEVDCSSCAKSITGYEVVVGETALDGSVSKQLIVDCPDGKRALGAGWSVLDSTSAILQGQATYSEPTFDGQSWMVNARNESAFAVQWKLRIRCVCAEVSE